MRANTLGGYQYDTLENSERARAADLVTLPPMNPNGAVCSNCQFFRSTFNTLGFCDHLEVKLPVTNRMCCSFWKNPGQINSWE